ncbi:YceD family protein [Cohnella nanjingensis]|uniref:DUF177 domain-containing protein n=1 Tax=Cohnella nanjingensis TaxID=1387779 RepID=A0A7X0RXI7_9BACL|nr:DUF177 domain-containing protein [Cohnella nanjingensis]MBB6675492.1 DUF177 domain-containing protein [Cohnella nanjingensis]
MLLNVQELVTRKEPVILQESIDVTSLFAEMRDATPLGPLHAQLTAIAADGIVNVTGTLTGKLQLLCSRCLTPLEGEYEFPYEETFKHVSQEVAARGEQDDEDFVPFHGERLELRPYVEEELMLSLPLAPLCKEDCKGLCPDCGQNRNEQACQCQQHKIDPRLEALKGWKPQA